MMVNKPILSNIENKYFLEDCLPKPCVDAVHPRILERFRSGKREFFIQVKNSFPEIFDFLCSKCSDLFIVDLDGEYFHWGIESERNYIFSAIAKTPRNEKLRISERPYYESLPLYLRPFYDCFSGFDISKKEQLSLLENGFFTSFSNWHTSEYLAKYKEGDSGYIDFLNRSRGMDYRLIFRSFDNKVVFLDMSVTESELYIADWEDFSTFRKLEEPIGFFTDSFLKAMNS